MKAKSVGLLALAAIGAVVPLAVACGNAEPASVPTASVTSSPPPTVASSSTPEKTADTTPPPPASDPPPATPPPPDEPPIPTAPDPNKKITAAACNKLLDAAQKELSQARNAAKTSCAKDADCVTIHSRACLADCGSDAIAASASGPFKTAADKVRDGKCKAWWDGSCPMTTPMPIPSCPMYIPTCKAGKCGSRQAP